MTERDLDALLHQAARRTDGRYRVVASKAVEGRPLGPFSYYGVRPDDPNDTIPHEHRRSLRGLRMFAAWINHVDVRSENSLDTVVRNETGLNVVRHHLIDFNATLGSAGIGPADRRSRERVRPGPTADPAVAPDLWHVCTAMPHNSI
jgi:hypothetical protein